MGHTIGSIFILDVMFLFQCCQLFFATRKLGFRSGCVLLRRHMIEYDNISFLHVEAVEVVERVLRLWIGKLTKGFP